MNKKNLYIIIGAVLLCTVIVLALTVFKPRQKSLEEIKNESSTTELTIWGKLDTKSITYDQGIPIFEITNDKGEKIKVRLRAPVPENFDKCNDVTVTGHYFVEMFVATAIDADCK